MNFKPGPWWLAWLPEEFNWDVAVVLLFAPALVVVGLACIGVGWYLERRKHRSSVQ